ncbi:MAG: 1-acyl-sn-glycerol-3-phosphate acyltransferase [Alphaproteobacteria bacterium]|uniref:lysophospholipid acyltransferase family protein n=1 Tax=Brevundimonas sp. TaxID=1871086 RepID=UPI001854672D|nr:lysophospholipid acyltransferase family protein [Brevundimonas sp.]MBA3051437.1 1-acyl-sn-glycerol-3-phosphate acyltransferase [Brevundimonas sp.]MBU3969232.1 1-acyl-sn-glycerol-3-phosphate acyltransferase [Alphaproteobacteria bacterium]MBU4136944.1 1-acyl-sn-glycerol-3-phosphate acyltransferase [Alphaproteobacteria bacterium]
MRSYAFNLAYWLLSILYASAAAFAALAPGRGATSWIIRRYVKRMVQAMRLFAGIRVEARGHDRLPSGAFIIASKHQSWGDGFATYDQFDDLAFVTGDHLEKFPLLGTVLRKLGAIVVNNCGGREAREALKHRSADAHAAGRRILIYPEGNLARVGEKFRYRSGVWHMYRDFNMPVVPLATNLGLFWPQEAFRKTPGTATLEFLDPIATGLGKEEFLARLEAAVEDRTAELIAEATGRPVTPAIRVLAPDEAARAGKAAPVTA